MKLIALLLSSFLLVSQALAEPPELTAARLAYEAKLALPKGKLDAALLARGKQYAGVIKALEDRAALDAKLDAVILLKAEREAYEQGRRTSGFGPNASKVSPEARSARLLLDGDVARLRATAAPEGRRLAVEYLTALEVIERKLTMQKDVTGAVEVRKVRTAVQAEGMEPLSSGSKGLIGDWRFVGLATDTVRTGRVFTFMKDGTWRHSGGKTGTWKWKGNEKKEISFKWNDNDWSDRYSISADGLTLKGADNQGVPMSMERIP